MAGTLAPQTRFEGVNTMQIPVLKRLPLWVLACALSATAFGQQTVEDEEVAEAPPMRVARLSYTQGGVTLQGVGETVWAQAPVNRPLTPGDYLRTDADGRAEVQVEENAIRLGGHSNFAFLALDDRAVRMRMTSGVLNIRVRYLGENDIVEVETPQGVASILRPGNYRVEVSPVGAATVVKVSSGMLEARGGANQSFVVRNQQVMTLTGKNTLVATTNTLGAPDSFDEWTLDRDQRLDEALNDESAKYVSNDVVGYEDLDDYGTWRNEPEYGHVWTPTRVVAGWTPYRYGRYAYVSGWGYTWIDDAPWGFAPFHYGNWVTISGRWCWVPGPRHRHSIGRPGRGGYDRGGDDRWGDDRWHIPRDPRGSTVRSGVPTRPDGTRQGFVRDNVAHPGFARGDVAHPGFIQPGDGTTRLGNDNLRMRTVPDGDRYRYVRPDDRRGEVPRGDIPRTDRPPVTVPSGDRWMRVPRNETPRTQMPRNEMPRNSYPRGDSRPSGNPRAPVMSSSPSRGEASRPSSPPPQQSAPRGGTPRGGFSRGGQTMER
jgi:hypothetical protein